MTLDLTLKLISRKADCSVGQYQKLLSRLLCEIQRSYHGIIQISYCEHLHNKLVMINKCTTICFELTVTVL